MPQQPTRAERAPAASVTPDASPTPTRAAGGGTLERDAAIRELFRVSGVPTNERQLAGLRIRRHELRDQRDNAREERADLQQRLTDGPDADTQRLLKQQLDAATGKVLSLDEAIATTERQIVAAPPELLASTQTVSTTPDMSQFVAEDDAAGIAVSTFGLGIVVTLLASRWRRRRRGRAAAVAAPAPDPQLGQLAIAVDAIALEVERIGEGQRFVTQLLAESGGSRLPLAPLRGAPSGSDARRARCAVGAERGAHSDATLTQGALTQGQGGPPPRRGATFALAHHHLRPRGSATPGRGSRRPSRR
ncbi:MAG TPA: hypothetical protein VGD56_01495 [Gemmatirosa sp.]